jgi:exodeoxyribonuclease X
MLYHILDLETSGLKPPEAKVVEVATVTLDEGLSYVRHYQSLVNPQIDRVPPAASAVHHLTIEDLRDQPPIDEIIPELDITPDDVIITHNVVFDSSFLQTWFSKANWLCTLKSARQLITADAYNNQYLRYFLQLQPKFIEGCGGSAHRALYDCCCTVELFKHLMQLSTVDHMLHLTRQVQLSKTITFGVHKGKPWHEVPQGYIRWLVNQGDLRPETKASMNHYLGLNL